MDIEFTPLLQNVIAPVTGIVLVGLIAYLRNSLSGAAKEELADLNNSQSEFQKNLLNRLNELESQIKERTIENFQLREEIMQVRFLISVLESAHHSLPFPAWLKDKDFRIVQVNAEYERRILKPSLGLTNAEYIGCTDHEMIAKGFPEAVVNSWVANDRQVWDSEKPWIGVESVPYSDTEVAEWVIFKYVYKVAEVKIGIAGLAIPKNLVVVDKTISEDD